MPVAKPLPERVDAQKFCHQSVRVAGDVPLSWMTRLLPQLISPVTGFAHAALQFGDEEHGRFSLTGTITAELPLVCQRCMQVYHYSVNATCNLGVVINDEQAKNLPRSLEPVLLDEGELNLWSVVEDELLLNLPLAPLHPSSVCSIATEYQGPALLVDANQVAKKVNPFQVLAKLKSSSSE